jgi:hypothetical protein
LAQKNHCPIEPLGEAEQLTAGNTNKPSAVVSAQSKIDSKISYQLA